MRIYILTITLLLMFAFFKAEDPIANAGPKDQFSRNNVAFSRKDLQNDVLANRLNSDVYFQIHDRQARSDEDYQVIIDKIEEYLNPKPPSDILIPKPEDLDFNCIGNNNQSTSSLS